MSSDSRSAILARIRFAIGKAAEDSKACRAEWLNVARSYDRTPRLTAAAKLDLFVERLRDYDAEITTLGHGQVAGAISAAMASRGDREVLMPQGFPADWIPNALEVTIDVGFSPENLNRFGSIITTASVGIAETGSLILKHAPGEGRRAASLLPDFHICVLRECDLVQSVPEAFARLEHDRTRPITFISGPSATADIEMTRIRGVHGPRFLHVIVVR